MINLEEVVDKLAAAMMTTSDDETKQRSNRETRLEAFIIEEVTSLIEELRVIRNAKNFLEIEVADLRNQVEEFNDG